MVRIEKVNPQTLAANCGIKDNDILISINDKEINDVLDYRFYLAENHIELCIKRENEILLLQ
jgi:NifB/MoaA-like Fe-S oxidoreductase